MIYIGILSLEGNQLLSVVFLLLSVFFHKIAVRSYFKTAS